jgi:Skp family chaperone for outer membrane proteins
MPAYLPIIVATINLMVLSVLGFYIWTLGKEREELKKHEKELLEKEKKLESGYQQIIDNALAKERAILDEASKKANAIVTNTQYASNISKDSLDQALQKMINDIQNQAANSSNSSLINYKNFLHEITEKTLVDFQNNTKKFEEDMQKQMQEFRDTLLPTIQKELEEYKKERFGQADKKINEIIQKVAEKVFNQSISLEDHQKLIIESLEKCRKEGIYD